MFKKLLIGLVVLVGGSVLLFGRDAYSYLTTSAKKLHSSVRDNVPLEFEIERAREMVSQLVPDIQENMHLIAREEVEIEDLARQIEAIERNMRDEQAKIVSLRSDLNNDRGKFLLAGRNATPAEVRTELNRRFDRYKTAEATLDAKRKMLESRRNSLLGARRKLDGMIAAKRDLEVQLQGLEARLKLVQAAQTTAQFSLDESQLSRAKKLVGELKRRLDVSERIIEREGRIVDSFEMELEPPQDLEAQVDKYFEGKTPPVAEPGKSASPKTGA